MSTRNRKAQNYKQCSCCLSKSKTLESINYLVRLLFYIVINVNVAELYFLLLGFFFCYVQPSSLTDSMFCLIETCYRSKEM